MQQTEPQAPEATDTNRISGSTSHSEYGNQDAGRRYKDGEGTTSVPSGAVTHVETEIHDNHASVTGTGIVDSGAQGAEPVQNTTKPLSAQ